MSPPRYAENTEVPVERSRAEIERLLKSHGATQFGSASDEEKGVAFVMFRLCDRMFRIEVKQPKADQIPKGKPPTAPTPHTRARWPKTIAEMNDRDQREYQLALKRYNDNERRKSESWIAQEERRRWRAQLLLIKAKLEMIATGETTAEREFMADMLMANGKTVAQAALPALAAMYRDGKMPKGGILMLGSGE